MTSSDRFPVPGRSAVKSNLTDWCFQNDTKQTVQQKMISEIAKPYRDR